MFNLKIEDKIEKKLIITIIISIISLENTFKIFIKHISKGKA